ncbi:MAG: 2-hydroxyacyl-CoA dehydratase [Planctomycetes bacterium]|nr:2-hydroxyacyl-CoA dehydratase [Planctomycetota bacterium]
MFNKYKEQLKERLTRRFAPLFLRECIRFISIFSRNDANAELDALGYLKRAGAGHLFDTYNKKSSTVWTTLFVPSELLFAMGLVPLSVEIAAALFAGLGWSTPALMEAESNDIPTDACTFHRAALGHMLKGYLPKPILNVATSTLCDSNTKTIKICESVTGKESIVLDVPFEKSDVAVKYLARQLEELTKRLENASGRRMDMRSFAEAIERSNRVRELLTAINQMRVNPFSPLEGSSALGFMFPTYLLIGSMRAVEFYSRLCSEIKEKLDAVESNGHDLTNGKQPEKKTKILWLELKPYFKNDFIRRLEKEQNVKIVFEETNHVYWDKMDPENPYESLAKKLISNQYNGPLERRIEVIKMLAKRYKVDGIVAFSSWGCRRNNAAVPTIKRELNREGFPLLSLDGDCIDDNNYMPGQFSTRIEGFLEMLCNRG